MRAATPCRAALRRATSRAAGEISVAKILRVWQLVGQRHGQATRAGAYVGHGQRIGTPRAQAGQRDLDHVLGFRPRNQHTGIYFEFQSPEFLPPGEILHRRARRPLLDELGEAGSLIRVEREFRMRVQKSAVAPENVHQEQFGRQRRRRHAVRLQARDRRAERAANVLRRHLLLCN